MCPLARLRKSSTLSHTIHTCWASPSTHLCGRLARASVSMRGFVTVECDARVCVTLLDGVPACQLDVLFSSTHSPAFLPAIYAFQCFSLACQTSLHSLFVYTLPALCVPALLARANACQKYQSSERYQVVGIYWHTKPFAPCALRLVARLLCPVTCVAARCRACLRFAVPCCALLCLVALCCALLCVAAPCALRPAPYTIPCCALRPAL